MKIKHKGYFVLCIIDILLSCISLVKGCLIDGRTERIFNVLLLGFFAVFFFIRSVGLDELAKHFGWDKED